MMENQDKILERVSAIFKKELNDDSLFITYSTSANDIEKWDSITNLVLISSIEDEFGITFPVEIIFDAKNVGDLCNYILKNAERG